MKMDNPENHIDKLNLDLLGLNFPVLVILIVAALAFAVWYYHDTVPPLAGWKKWILVTLRASALALLFIGFAEPVLEVISTVAKKSRVAVLIDTSSSMNQKNDPMRKKDAIEVMNKIRSYLGKDCIFFGFDSLLRSFEQSVPEFNGSGTDLLNAIIEAKNKQDVSSIILISDGRWNLGENPAGSNLPDDIPVNTVTAGSDDYFTDVVINKISSAAIGHEGSNHPVEIIITSTKEMSGAVPVEIVENNRILAEGEVSFRSGTMARINFNIPLNRPGDHTFSAIIKPGDDRYPENNIRFFDVHVVKSSFRVLIAADKPSADLSFIRRVVESDNTLELDIIVDKGISGPLKAPFPEDVSGFDAFIMINWGGSVLNPQNAEILQKWVSSGGGLWIIGSSPPGIGANVINNILPVTFSNKESLQDTPFYMELTEVGSTHFITSKDSDREREWNILPPLISILPVSKVSSDGRVLAEAVMVSSKNNTLPAIVTGKYGSGKILVMPISGMWRWQLMMEGAGKGGAFYKNFVLGAINWLTSDVDTSPLTVTSDHRTYLSGQEITFEARLYDNVYSPVSGAEITLVIDSDPASKIILQETKPSVYTGTLRSLEGGEHSFKAIAFLDGRRFAESTGAFTVQNFSLELLDTTVNKELMRTIAARTGGLSVTPSGIDSILTQIKPEIMSERHENKHHFYLNPLLPLLIVLLLSVEWSIRKYRGMI